MSASVLIRVHFASALLFGLCQVVHAQTNPARPSPEEIFQRIQADWAALDGGLRYEARGYSRALAIMQSAPGRNPGDGTPPLPQRGAIVPLSEPKEERWSYTITWKDGEYLYTHTRTKDGRSVSRLVAADKIYYLKADGTAVPMSRSPGEIEGLHRVPAFLPRDPPENWCAYPWAGGKAPKDARFSSQVLDETNDSATIEVRMEYAQRDGKFRFMTRRLHLKNLPDLGWLPVRIERYREAGSLAESLEIGWSKVRAADRTVAIPATLTKKDFVIDPASGSLIPNSDSGYEIILSSIQSLATASDRTPWDVLKTKPKPPRVNTLTASEMMRRDLLTFAACFGVTLILIFCRRHRPVPIP